MNNILHCPRNTKYETLFKPFDNILVALWSKGNSFLRLFVTLFTNTRKEGANYILAKFLSYWGWCFIERCYF